MARDTNIVKDHQQRQMDDESPAPGDEEELSTAGDAIESDIVTDDAARKKEEEDV